VYGFYGITAAFIIIIIFLLIAFICVFFIKRHPPIYIPKESIWKSLSEGIHFVFHNKMMIGAMSLDLFSVFFGGAVALLPVFANEILHVGPQGLGIMRATSSLGAVIVYAGHGAYIANGQTLAQFADSGCRFWFIHYLLCFVA